MPLLIHFWFGFVVKKIVAFLMNFDIACARRLMNCDVACDHTRGKVKQARQAVPSGSHTMSKHLWSTRKYVSARVSPHYATTIQPPLGSMDVWLILIFAMILDLLDLHIKKKG